MLIPNHPTPTASCSQISGLAGPELRCAAANGTVGDTLLPSLASRPP